ncbi:hypothetical protein PTSG_11216 [Salpingoeca rosetta]|uniref:Uncharacterized protein n=1 Tax=Salpingoeca rosetta (strain ATCC 50818 / BSB-021) TaxID=946362 RepID=F2USR6_SALR5|nr:uncharacterized protein PTSG_11216 [Salpingoeca rosetta]EGD81175.1 hypothetical protein PTSG_11216 [Salpingoeca rosetta]|eukprot:XP_004987860.1 hypothetical protein PTSG_11216 [Salpingoeca rosetta]
MCTEGCTGTSCTTASHPTDSHGHCTFAVIECCQHVAPPQPATSSSPSPTLPSTAALLAVLRGVVAVHSRPFCQPPSLHAAGFKQLTALDAFGPWTTTLLLEEGLAVIVAVVVVLHAMTSTAAVDERQQGGGHRVSGSHACAGDVAQERFKDYDNDSVPFMKNILQHANDRQYRMLRGLMGVSVCNDMFAPDAHDLMHIMVPGSRESPNTSATENCISAFVKVAHGLSEMLTHLLDWLSITEDDDEAKYIFTYLLQSVNPRETAPECPVIGTPAAAVDEPHCQGMYTASWCNMQDSPAHGVLGQLMQDPEVHTRVQRAVEALSSSA